MKPASGSPPTGGDVRYRYELLPVRRFAFVSDGVTELTGYTPQEHYTDPDLGLKLIHPGDIELLAGLIGGERIPASPLLLRWITSDGRLIWTQHRMQARRDNGGRVVAIEGRVRDVTREKALDGHEFALAEAVTRSQEGVLVTDASGMITYVNQAFAEMAGYQPAELIGQNPRILQSGAHSDAFYRNMWRRLADGRSFSGGFVNRRKDGSLYREAAIVTGFRDDQGHIAGYVAIMRNTTAEQAAIEELAIERAQRSAVVSALARMEPGDDAFETARLICRQLLTISDIQVACVIALDEGRAIPLVLEAAEGEPLPLPRSLPAKEATLLHARSITGPWVERAVPGELVAMGAPALARNINVHGGIALGQNGGLQGFLVIGAREQDAGVVDRLQLALGEFGPLASALLVEDLRRRGRLRSDRRLTRRIIRSGEFEPVFQPVVNLLRGTVVGYELLTRFADGAPPQHRFAAAHRIGLEGALEKATLSHGIQVARGLPADAWLALNVSPELLRRPSVLMKLVQHAERPVVLELTEHRAVEGYARARAAVEKLGRGVSLAVDDAGAGYASLQLILELRPAYAKLDLTIVRGISRDPARQALVAGFRFFADRIGCTPIAEGIESEEDLRTLLDLGITLGQGYLLGRPARIAEILARPPIKPGATRIGDGHRPRQSSGMLAVGPGLANSAVRDRGRSRSLVVARRRVQPEHEPAHRNGPK